MRDIVRPPFRKAPEHDRAPFGHAELALGDAGDVGGEMIYLLQPHVPVGEDVSFADSALFIREQVTFPAVVHIDNAESAALRDPRFPPVTAEELSELTIEISVLSPLKEVSDPEDVEVGKHGLIMTRGSLSGVLLPQVPVEWGWNREQFLSQTCRKAGLPGDCWKQSGTQIQAFTADVFSEKDFGLK